MWSDLSWYHSQVIWFILNIPQCNIHGWGPSVSLSMIGDIPWIAIHGFYPQINLKHEDEIWVCLKIGYIPNYSHLIGIMISKTIGFRGTRYFQTHPYRLNISSLFRPWIHMCFWTIFAGRTANRPSPARCLCWRKPALSSVSALPNQLNIYSKYSKSPTNIQRNIEFKFWIEINHVSISRALL